MTRRDEGWVLLARSRSAKRDDTWLPYGDVDIGERVEFIQKNGNEVMHRKADQPEREATVFRQRWQARAVVADMEAMGAQVVLLPARADGEKLKGAPVEELMVKAAGAWEAKQA